MDTLIRFSKAQSKRLRHSSKERESDLQFRELEFPGYKHTSNDQSDIKSTRTLLHELSRYGPCLAKGDVNGDQLDDFFVGGEPGHPAKIFIQQADGSFKTSANGFEGFEKDGYALFFDADGDDDPDLYTAKASTSSLTEAKAHKLYFNNGKGIFTFGGDALPDITTSASCVESADYDNDGDMDLFVGGRFKASGFPLSPNSYILKNEGGKFVDVTNSLNPQLANPGMVSSAVWTDINNDKKIDLVITGEWQPIRVFLNEGDRFTDFTVKFGLGKSNGWWNCLQTADLNNDGFTDLVVGNTGKNSYFQPTSDHPVQVVAKDFDGNGSMDPIVTYYNPVEKDRFIVHNRLVLIDQIPGVKRRFETFTQYATRPFKEVFSEEELEGAFTGSAYQLASVILINNHGTGFTMMELPEIAQISTINDILVHDLNEDGAQDIIAIGNMYAQETLFGRYDASIGTILLGDGKLNWKELAPPTSGFVVDSDARYIESLRTAQGSLFVITNNDDSIQFFAPRDRELTITTTP